MGRSTTEELLLIGSVCFKLYVLVQVMSQEHCGMSGLPLSQLRFLFMGELEKRQIMCSLNQNALRLLRCVSKEQLAGSYLTQLIHLSEHLNWLSFLEQMKKNQQGYHKLQFSVCLNPASPVLHIL